ncbi:MAG TPA: isoleucine--tRNA ligase [Armatimonadetes bacterium]|nr:isoleucine--tRNA ligase [Armatimonadota bacterium]
MFKEVKSGLNFPEMERRILDLWKEGRTFEKLREKNAGHKPWSFIDGPITANNPMGVHHAWGRTYKDIFQRFKAMQGYEERYQNGFDCQGLWVEVEVEKELGLNSKREIMEYGLDKFALACRARVEKYSALQTEQSIRLGQWMDWENSYYTMTDNNIEHIWHFLKTAHERGWLYKGQRAMPWCARCGTSLSQHELIDSYRDLTHTSIYAKLPILERPGEYMLVWTTTPWTLTANVALAVHPDLEYAKVKQSDGILYLSAGTVQKLEGDYELLGMVKGRDLVGLHYRGPFFDIPAQKEVDTKIVPWEDVGEEEGVGVVHIAPGCGEEDYNLGRDLGLPVLVPIDENGYYYSGYGWLEGKPVSEVASMIFQDLEEKGMLYKTEAYKHRYPVCWRCHAELVFRLVDEWFISGDEIRQPMIEAARKVHWVPDYAGKRMEDWLNNMGDWCISRKRFWGLPLPFYKCQCGEMTIIGSKKELEELAVSGIENLRELHRPWIDDVKIKCPKCGGTAERIPEVGDCWLDAGIVPFSTLGYLSEDKSYWEKWFPAEFVVEMREQIRLWFYSMLFMSVTLTGRSPYKNVLVYEKVHDEKGRPMHKSHGNAIWFDEAVEKMGADIMRWIYAGSNIQNNLNFGYGKGDDVVRNLLTLWNVYSFFVTYAVVDEWVPSKEKTPPASELDRWILARLSALVADITKSLEAFDTADVTRLVDAFVDDLSNWFVRLSRRRFWKSQADADKQSAYSTLYEVLVTLTKLLAPVLPFMAEEMYQNLVLSVSPDAPASVHLCDWPVPDEAMLNRRLIEETDAVMKVVRLGRSARNSAGMKVRQPLAKFTVKPATNLEREAVIKNERLILDELNIKSLVIEEDAAKLVKRALKPNFAVMGPKFGKLMPKIQKALSMEDTNELAAKILAGESAHLAVDGETVELEASDVTVEMVTPENISAAEEAGTVVAVDTALTPELMQEGLVRDLVRQIQNMRKDLGFNVDDRITIEYSAEGAFREAVPAWEEYIRQETLANSVTPSSAPLEKVKVAGEEIGLKLEKA